MRTFGYISLILLILIFIGIFLFLNVDIIRIKIMGINCEPGEYKCDGNLLLYCRKNVGYIITDVCSEGCSDGKCSDNGCFDGQSDCFGNIEYTCFDGQWIPSYSNRCDEKDFFSEEYREKTIRYRITNEYLKENMFDCSDPVINNLVESLRVEDDPESSVRNVMLWTYYNIDYDFSDEVFSLEYCENMNATGIIGVGKGVCSTMSRVNLALLRCMGISSYMNTGCVKPSGRCEELSTLRLIPENKFDDGVMLVSGGAHSWISVWIPDKGWLFLESTRGELYPSKCLDYDIYYPNPQSTRKQCSIDGWLIDKCEEW